MDGLPVVEQTGLPFASTVRAMARSGVETGVMHACGHDTHMTSFIGTARQMVARKSDWSGTLVMIQQPGEETGEGAKAMLDDGLFTRFPKPSYAIAFHDAAAGPAGTIGITPGYALANVDSVDIDVKGVGGHGAYPQHQGSSRSSSERSSCRCRPWSAARSIAGAGRRHRWQLPGWREAQHHLDNANKLLLTVRSYTPECASNCSTGSKKSFAARLIASGMPEDRMPLVTVREGEYTPSTFNTQPLSDHALALFTESSATNASPRLRR